MAASSNDVGIRGAFTSEISGIGQQLLEELEGLQQEATKHGDLYSDASGDELDINFEDPEKRGMFFPFLFFFFFFYLINSFRY